MADKRFQNIDTLRDIAETLPTQRTIKPVPVPVAERVPAALPDDDPAVQIAFAARFSTRKRMFQAARDRDVTLKTLILSALREKYPELDIRDVDLEDQRKKGNRRS